MKNFGLEIERLRAYCGYSQTKLARLAEVSKPDICAIEHNKYLPSMPLLLKILEVSPIGKEQKEALIGFWAEAKMQTYGVFKEEKIKAINCEKLAALILDAEIKHLKELLPITERMRVILVKTVITVLKEQLKNSLIE